MRVLDIHGNKYFVAKNKIEVFFSSVFLAGESHCKIIHGLGSGVLSRMAEDACATSPLVKTWRHPHEEPGGSGCIVAEMDN